MISPPGTDGCLKKIKENNLKSRKMKIKVESEKIVKAVKKLDGVEIVLENPHDAKEAINLVLKKTGLLETDEYSKLTDIKVSSFQNYETSAVNYKMMFLLEFLFEDDIPSETKVAALKRLQELLNKV
jgi:copper chaperone CopZ